LNPFLPQKNRLHHDDVGTFVVVIVCGFSCEKEKKKSGQSGVSRHQNVLNIIRKKGVPATASRIFQNPEKYVENSKVNLSVDNPNILFKIAFNVQGCCSLEICT
jgi:hypothetical protein